MDFSEEFDISEFFLMERSSAFYDSFLLGILKTIFLCNDFQLFFAPISNIVKLQNC